MKSREEFLKLSDDSLKDLLKKQGTHIPKIISHEQLIDYAINRLHGTEFINTDEKEIKGKITKQITIPKPIPGETCPSCKQKTLRKLKLPDTNAYHGYSYCSYCGLYQSPDEQKTKKSMEAKA